MEPEIVQTNRRKWLVRLKQTYGTLRALADATETNPAHLSQINIGAREMGEAVARRIEHALGFPPKTLDGRVDAQVVDRSEPTGEDEPAAAVHPPPLERVPAMTDNERAALEAMRGLTDEQQRQKIEEMLEIKTKNEQIVAEMLARQTQQR